VGVLPRRQFAQEKKAEDVGRGRCAAGMRYSVVHTLAPLTYVPSLFASLTHLIATESALTLCVVGALVYDRVHEACLQFKSATVHMIFVQPVQRQQCLSRTPLMSPRHKICCFVQAVRMVT